MGFLSSIFTWQHFINLLDIGVVWYAIYKLMMLLRGTKAVQLFKGVLVIIVIKLVSWYLGLRTVSWITDQIINWGIIAIIVIFQPEIRRGEGRHYKILYFMAPPGAAVPPPVAEMC